MASMDRFQPPAFGLSQEDEGPPFLDRLLAFTGGFFVGYAIGDCIFGRKGDKQGNCCAGSSAFVVVALLVLAVLL